MSIHAEICPICQDHGEECICCPECGHDCALDHGESYCKVCGGTASDPGED
ncbi:MAG: hypothetical protein OEV59_01415 [Deltaproteobacteria bacterium]|nr:hypothetical protein [Deltaproteobacteria bacterium]